jgi:hypothetical protein
MSFNRYTPDIEGVDATEASGPEPSAQPILSDNHEVRGRSFDQLWGLHPGVALFAIVVNTMLFGGELVTMGAIFPLSIAVGMVLGFVTYRAQKCWAGDDDENAMIKAVIMTVLTVIPTPLPDFLYLSSGALGLVHSLRRDS